jgi:hypothetical protein
MLSVLIPVYNFNVTELVKELHKQLVASNIDFEIICLDDKSKKHIIDSNLKIETLSNTSYKLSNSNNGIAVNRQMLVDLANYDWIILIDADVELKDDQFISNYLEVLDKGYNFIFGGFEYKNKAPKKSHLLRWKYGKKYEAILASSRNSNPYKVTIAANMLARKAYYMNLNLDFLGNNYAMDYLFGALLKEHNEKVLHINNQVYHLGIEDSVSYLRKKEMAVETLLKLYHSKKIKRHSNSLLKVFILLKNTKMNYLLSLWFSVFNKSIRNNLTGNKPYIILLQLYKISYMCYLDLNKG